MDDREPTLNEVAEKAMERAHGNHVVATRMLLSTVMTNASLLVELFGLSRDDVRERVELYLRDGVSHSSSASRYETDHPEPAPFERSRPSQVTHESQGCLDRLAAPSMREGGESQTTSGRQGRCDLPARSAPVRKISTAAALSVARSVFDFQIGVNVKLGDLTLDDVVNAERKVFFAAHLTKHLRENVPWPDRTTPLREFCPKVVAEAIWTNAQKALEAQPLPQEVANAR